MKAIAVEVYNNDVNTKGVGEGVWQHGWREVRHHGVERERCGGMGGERGVVAWGR